MNRHSNMHSEGFTPPGMEFSSSASTLGPAIPAVPDSPTTDTPPLLRQIRLPLPLGTFILDSHGYIVQHIPPFESTDDLTAPNPEALIGQPVSTVLSQLSPIAGAAETGNWLHFQHALTGASERGEWIYALATQVPVRQFRIRVQKGSGKKAVPTLLTHEECTPSFDLAFELNRIGEHQDSSDLVLGELLRQLPVGVVVAEAPSGRFLLANQKVSELLGRPIILMENVHQYATAPNYHPDGRPFEARDYPLSQAVLYGRTVVDQEIIVHRQDGGIRHVRSSAAPLRNASGEVIAAIATFTDITNKVLALKELKRTQERYARVAESGHVGIWEISLNADAMYLSPNLKSILGYTDAELPNSKRAWCSTLHPDDKAPAEKAVEDYLAGRQSKFTFEVRRRHKNGNYLWFLVQGSAVWDANHNPVSLVGSDTDITERKKAEEALRNSEECLRLALEAGKAGIFDWDLKTGWVNWSEQVYEIHGVQHSDFDSSFESFVKLVHPEDVSIVQGAAESAFRTNEPFQVEFRAIRPDGEVRWIATSAQTSQDAAGNPIRLVGATTDITDRKLAEQALRESEERLRLGLEAGRTGLWDWDVVNNRVTWSPRIYEIHGLSPEEFDGTVEGFTQRIHPEDLPRVQERLNASLRSGQTYEVEFRIVRPDGCIRWIATAGNATLNAQGEPIRVVGATSDVTEQREIELNRETLLESERAARSEMERALRIKDEFLATLSHELRTPMNSILGWSTLLQSYGIDTDLRTEGLAAIDRNARIQTQIIEDLLDMSRITAGKLQLKVIDLDLSNVVLAAIETVQPAAQARQIKLRFIPPAIPHHLWGDPNRLQQVIWNLLSNAVKFSTMGSEVLVRIGKAAGPNDEIQLTVEDSGEGIDSAFIPYVFDRFRQADSSTTRRHGGLGLGLAIVKQLVELHGGRIEVASAGRGQGTAFIVTLPARHQPLLQTGGQELPPETTANAPAPDIVGPLEGKRVLVVDDEVDVREMISQVLELDGASVTSTYATNEAWDLLHLHSYDVLISDISMPHEDGYSFIKRLRQEPEPLASIPALALTAFGRGEDKERALAAGFNAHQTKPVEPANLVQALLKMLDAGK